MEKKPERSYIKFGYIIWWTLLSWLHDLQSRLGVAEKHSDKRRDPELKRKASFRKQCDMQAVLSFSRSLTLIREIKKLFEFDHILNYKYFFYDI